MSGDGLAADSSGNLYFLDANGTFDSSNITTSGFPASGDYGNAMIKLSTSGKLAVADYFDEYNTDQESSADLDLGSGGEILLPDLTDAGGAVHHLIVGAGKDANIYLADRDNMGKYNSTGDSNIYQQVSGQLAGKVYSTPAYFNQTLYYGAVGDSVKAFPIANAQLGDGPVQRFGHDLSLSRGHARRLCEWNAERHCLGARIEPGFAGRAACLRRE